MSKHSKLYKDTPALERDKEDGEMKVSKPSDKDKKSGAGAGEDGSNPDDAMKEGLEGRAKEMHDRHLAEMKDMHGRHEKEHKDMHKRHQKEIKKMHGGGADENDNEDADGDNGDE